MMSLIDSIQDFLNRLSSSSELSKTLVTLASAVGIIVCLTFVVCSLCKLFRVFRLYVLSQYCCQTDFVKKYGQWAVVSGATDGIGQEMAKELASRGMSVIVIGRNNEKLANTKAMLEKVPNAGEVLTVKSDLSDSSPENFDRIRAQIDPDQRDIGVLVNCAGLGPSVFAPFTSLERSGMTPMVNVNVLALVHLTRIILPGMAERKRGLVMNVSSMMGALSWPWMGVYPATKAFVNSFTRQLQLEYGKRSIDIVLLETGAVMTKMAGPNYKQESTLMAPPPDAYARSAIRAQAAGVKEYAGMFVHEFATWATRLVIKLGLRGPAARSLVAYHERHLQGTAPATGQRARRGVQ